MAQVVDNGRYYLAGDFIFPKTGLVTNWDLDKSWTTLKLFKYVSNTFLCQPIILQLKPYYIGLALDNPHYFGYTRVCQIVLGEIYLGYIDIDSDYLRDLFGWLDSKLHLCQFDLPVAAVEIAVVHKSLDFPRTISFL